MNCDDTHCEWEDMHEETMKKNQLFYQTEQLAQKFFCDFLSSGCTKKKRTSIQFYMKSNFPLFSFTYFAHHTIKLFHTYKREIQNYK